jgi:hypothetical protein
MRGPSASPWSLIARFVCLLTAAVALAPPSLHCYGVVLARPELLFSSRLGDRRRADGDTGLGLPSSIWATSITENTDGPQLAQPASAIFFQSNYENSVAHEGPGLLWSGLGQLTMCVRVRSNEWTVTGKRRGRGGGGRGGHHRPMVMEENSERGLI